ncbi:MAG TPA: site-specific integrase, partial [Gammaproteobacteria bacterium]|nr:site-specific integrase [Gammaproteobacteria bacterium]
MSTISPTPIFDNLDYLKLTPVTSDGLKYSIEFLNAYAGSTATFSAYRREVERLLHWCIEIANKSLRDVTRADFEVFLKFCQNPPKSWIGLKNVTRFIEKEGLRTPNPEWRPFVVNVSKKNFHDGARPSVDDYLLSQSALQAIFAITSSFYQFLIQEGYSEINPVTQIRQKSQFLRKIQGTKIIRKLSELQWN